MLSSRAGAGRGLGGGRKLLRARYPQLDTFYKTTRLFTATKGMDGQTVIHTVILLFILIGNIAYMTRRASQGKRSGTA